MTASLSNAPPSKVWSIVLLATVMASLSCHDATGPFAGAKYLVSFSPTPAVAGTYVVVTAQLVDASGNNIRLAGRVVTWSNPAHGQAYPEAKTTTSADGSATTTILLRGLAGVPQTITATDDQGISGSTAEFTSVAGPPDIYIVTAASKTAVAGSTVAIAAQLADRYSNPIPVAGRTITWSVVGSGTFSSPTSTTDSRGIASVNLTLGGIANVTTTVQLHDDQNLTGFSVRIVTTAGPAAQYLVSVSESDPPPGAPVSVVAQLADATGNPLALPGTRIAWTSTGAGAGFSPNPSITIGDGHTTTVFTPSAVVGASYVVTAADPNGIRGNGPSIVTQPLVSLASIASGQGSTSACGWSATGVASCWGSNGLGQLGNGTTLSRALAGRVGGNLNLAAMSVGRDFACGLTPGGVAYCWGGNSSGQLGDNSFIDRPLPTAVTSALTLKAVTAGGAHACGVATNGDAYCWGNNLAGQLGNGTRSSSSAAPVKVTGGLSFAAISAGGSHTCGITTGGIAYCWGLNDDGQLGDLSTTTRSAPVPVAGGVQFTSLSAGGAYICGIASDGGAWCWGNNDYGQLGTGTLAGSHTRPAAVSGGFAFGSIVAGGVHTCAITRDGVAYCWGDNLDGELGNGTKATANAPSPVAGGLLFRSIGVGSAVTASGSFYYYGPSIMAYTCGVTTGGTAYCWGSNDTGQLGAGRSVATSSAPLKLAGQP